MKNIIACNDYANPVQRRTPTLSSRLPNLAKVMAAAGYHVELKGKLHLTRPVEYDAAAEALPLDAQRTCGCWPSATGSTAGTHRT